MSRWCGGWIFLFSTTRGETREGKGPSSCPSILLNAIVHHLPWFTDSSGNVAHGCKGIWTLEVTSIVFITWVFSLVIGWTHLGHRREEQSTLRMTSFSSVCKLPCSGSEHPGLPGHHISRPPVALYCVGQAALVLHLCQCLLRNKTLDKLPSCFSLKDKSITMGPIWRTSLVPCLVEM